MQDKERVRRRILPHWDMPGATYFVTSCLAGSVPAEGLLDVKRYRSELAARTRPSELSREDWETRKQKLLIAGIDKWLDGEAAVRWFETAELAKVVVDAFFFGANERYDLFAFAVMPSHVHWLFRPRADWIEQQRGDRSPREVIVHAFNLHTARQCNAALGCSGDFLQHECYDHWVRDEDELERILPYVDDNPRKAGLVKDPSDWKCSSAWYRQHRRITLGHPCGCLWREASVRKKLRTS